jgi:acyl carrier protein
MIRSFFRAAAAAGALSSATVPQDAAPSTDDARFAVVPHSGGRSERARILGIAAEVQKLVARFGETEVSAITAPRSLVELGLGDVERADLALGLEARFDIDIAEDETHKWQTVGDVVGFMARVCQAPQPEAS